MPIRASALGAFALLISLSSLNAAEIDFGRPQSASRLPLFELTPRDTIADDYYVGALVGPIYESNPSLRPQSPMPDTVGTSVVAGVGGKIALGTATSLGANYALATNQYLDLGVADFQRHELDVPARFIVSEKSEIRVRPFVSYFDIGHGPHFGAVGLSVMGSFSEGDLRHWVQGSIFQDRFFDLSLRRQSGIHYRFEYDWELERLPVYFRFSFWLEHDDAGRDADSLNSLIKNYSHNDFGFQAIYARTMGAFEISGIISAAIRIDQIESKYFIANSVSDTTSGQRTDLDFYFRPQVGYALTPSWQIVAYGELARRASSFGRTDYSDKNFMTVATGIALRAFFEKRSI